jgi:hypothetical protein
LIFLALLVFVPAYSQNTKQDNLRITNVVDGLSAHEQRIRMTLDILSQPRLDTGWHYSNFGFVIAGLMRETAYTEAYGVRKT